jgi:hypothetical protein
MKAWEARDYLCPCRRTFINFFSCITLQPHVSHHLTSTFVGASSSLKLMKFIKMVYNNLEVANFASFETYKPQCVFRREFWRVPSYFKFCNNKNLQNLLRWGLIQQNGFGSLGYRKRRKVFLLFCLEYFFLASISPTVVVIFHMLLQGLWFFQTLIGGWLKDSLKQTNFEPPKLKTKHLVFFPKMTQGLGFRV